MPDLAGADDPHPTSVLGADPSSSRTAAAPNPLWAGVDRLVDRAPSLPDLVAHRLHLFAARRWREQGIEVPAALALEELAAIARTAGARAVLARARAAYDGRLLVLKGLEVAARYPEPALRPSSDIDLLADDPDEAQRALVAAGFRAIGPYPDDYYTGLHHLRPLELPGLVGPFVEIHSRPNWVTWVDPPDVRELLAVAVTARCDVPGLLAPPAEYHAPMLAAHSWGEIPLRRVIDLVDVLAVSQEADRRRIEALATRWGLSRLWRTTIEAAEALLLGAPMPSSLRTWGRDLRVPRDRSVVEDHVRRWVSPFWAHPPLQAAGAAAVAVVHDAAPAPGEAWSNKIARAREALAHPARRVSEHQRVLGPEHVRPRHKRR